MANKPRDKFADEIVAALCEQLGTFSYFNGKLRRADVMQSVTLTREQWAQISQRLVPWLVPEARPTADDVAFWAVMEQIRKARRNGETISDAVAITRAGRATGTSGIRQAFYRVKKHVTKETFAKLCQSKWRPLFLD